MSKKLVWYEQRSKIGNSFLSSALLSGLPSGTEREFELVAIEHPDAALAEQAVILLSESADFSFLSDLPETQKKIFVFEHLGLSNTGKILAEQAAAFCSMDKVFFTSISATRQFNQQQLANGFPRAFFLPYPVERILQIPSIPKLNLSAVKGRPVIAFSGGMAIEYRAHKIFAALSGLNLHLRWLIADSEKIEALELLEEFGIDDFQLFQGRNPQTWADIVADADVCFHTHFSAYNSPSIYSLVSLYAGKRVVLSSAFDGNEFPDEITVKIAPGCSESTRIRAKLEDWFEPANCCLANKKLVDPEDRFYDIQAKCFIEQNYCSLASISLFWESVSRMSVTT